MKRAFLCGNRSSRRPWKILSWQCVFAFFKKLFMDSTSSKRILARTQQSIDASYVTDHTCSVFKPKICPVPAEVCMFHGLFTLPEYDTLVSGVHQLPPSWHYRLHVRCLRVRDESSALINCIGNVRPGWFFQEIRLVIFPLCLYVFAIHISVQSLTW